MLSLRRITGTRTYLGLLLAASGFLIKRVQGCRVQGPEKGIPAATNGADTVATWVAGAVGPFFPTP